MRSPRWLKLLRDMKAGWGRSLLMVAAVSVSLVAVGAVLGAYSILSREISASYLGTRPASATLEMAAPQGIDAALLAEVRAHPLVAEAEAREVIVARAKVGEDWRRTLLFVVDDFSDLRLNRFDPETGAWPPPLGTMLIERSSVEMVGAETGGRVRLKSPHGEVQEVPVSGLVHDSGLAPAWQERSGYGYVTRATVQQLGESPALHELRVELRDTPPESRLIEERAATLARWLTERGHPVHEIRVPPPAQHPHQRQMTTILAMLFGFSVMALVLSAVLVATSLAAMLARQVREIGVMKVLGARSGQLAGLYAAFVGALGAVSVLLAVPLSVVGARVFSGVIARMLNFDLASTAIPGWVFAVQALSGILVPLAVASVPIGRASRTTIRQALDDHGVSGDRPREWPSALPMPLRSALRRPARLALTLGLLSVGGAMFMTAINVKRGWEANVAKLYETRSYDVEIQLQAPQPLALAERLRQLELVRTIEPWGVSPAAFARPGQIDVVRTYPDRGHGSLWVMGPPPETRLVALPLKAGRWLSPGDHDAVVLNHAALAQSPQLKVGDPVSLSLEGLPTTWKIVGIVEEIGSPGIAYVTDEAFARVTGTSGKARMLRIATAAESPEERTASIRALEDRLALEHVAVESAIPLAELRTAVGDHILILVRALVAMALILAIVGTLGLGSTMSVNVVERTREIAVMKTLGATPGRVTRMLVAEGTMVGAVSWLLALALAVPLSRFVDTLIGNLGFLAPLPLVLSRGAIGAWLGLVVVVSFGATLLPAWKAAGRVVREGLAQP
ncbi:MAG: FtsX-like permease family protein [Deltaproteobacteria bacterium]|nr:FtsX-like permease family protein [Deltaproteobacteria bacterium]